MTGSEPAFPVVHPLPGGYADWGLSKRELFAAMAMQGMLADSDYWSESYRERTKHVTGGFQRFVAADAVDLADALIAELAKEAK